ncbi:MULTISPECIES: GspH/FimT family pseudopilin [unclassified Bradyrhizobium]|uniref:GspH/FimT family pseudopilin n=1 Tax=unclassified Bradyrhizobium TaxID=2631580 RepID=UPI0028E1DD02|nr:MULTISPECIES: GspH/FimT family pseudopilin [unclassified Bradyrhizobium]
MTKLALDQQRSAAAGFTLVEMLVVLGIIALMVATSMPLLSNGSDTLRLETASGEITAALRATRAAAIVQNSIMTLKLDVDRRTFGSAVVPQRSFAPTIDAELTFAAATRSASSVGGFQFFPDGSSTGGDLVLTLNGKKARLCVDWLTGMVRTAGVC